MSDHQSTNRSKPKTDISSPRDANPDPELDVTSEKFNPLRALYAPNYKITDAVPKVLYQNLAAFESALNKFGIWQLNKRQKSETGSKNQKEQVQKEKPSTSKTSAAAIAEVPQRRFELHQMPITSTSNKKHQRNIFTYMETSVGPMALLKKCVPLSKAKDPMPLTRRIRVRVVIRKQGVMGGSVEGELLAFDKQWNLLLRNATETWKRRKFSYGHQNICDTPVDCSDRLKELGITLPRMQVKSLNRKNVEIIRELPQVLIRGENVVLVNLIDKPK
ncbi:U7 snRNA-associated Sm-like protein LSm11 [Drosophila serrata]|uniref:U7 snRNA-associated Sm-like protein LSm11 n=1 Tax=Drosophila serrata TaxID=7274 RepID=UPI000A1D2CF2|nr:U7 snRNA-associated Sm-like protein LSm11 [Drosophila serrata]